MHFPPIQDAAIAQFQLMFLNLANDPRCLESPECTYSEVVKDFFRKFGLGGMVASGGSIFDGAEKIDAIEDQIAELINDLNILAGQLKTSDHSERLSYFRTKAGLIEKLINMRERIYSVKENSEFQSVILGFLEDICTKDQVSQLLKRLGHMPSIMEKGA